MPASNKERRAGQKRIWERENRLKNPEYYLWKAAKKRSRDNNLEFDIIPADIIIPQFCPLLNIPIIHKTGTGKRRYNSPSLDRLNNKLGYIRSNILVVSWRANFLKSDASINELRLLLNNLEAIY